MKKTIIIAIVIILGVAVLIYAMRDKSEVKEATPNVTTENGNFKPDPSNATFTIEDETITLASGKNESETAPGSAMTEETTLMDKFAYGDLNADGKVDTALLLARYGGGSGTFIYAAAFVSGPVNYKGTQTVFIGDRIVPQSIAISGGIVTVTYLDRKADEALAVEPTILESKQFIYRNGEFQEK